MSRNTGIDPLRRAAGVILWHLEHGGDGPSAVAKASARQTQLSEGELRYCLGWALAAQRFRDLARDMGPSATLGNLIDDSGLRPFLTGENRDV